MATLYVDKTHVNASNSWTRAQNSASQPWLTVRRAADLAIAGDTVIVVGDGETYLESSAAASWSVPILNPANEGTASNPIRFVPFESHAVTIQSAAGGGPVIGSTKDYVIWEGFTTRKAALGWCEGSELGYLHIDGPGIGSAATDGTVIHAGIVCHQLGPGCRIHHCEIEGYFGVNQNHCGIIIWQMSAPGPGVVEDNNIHDCWTGIYTKDADLNNIYRRNYIHDTTNGSFFCNNQGADAGFEVYDNYFDARVEVLVRGDGQKFHDNIVPTISTFVTTSDTITNLSIWNNVRQTNTGWSQQWTRTGNEFAFFDYNFYTGTPSYTFKTGVETLSLAQMQALGFETHSDDGISLASIYNGSWELLAPYTTAGRGGAFRSTIGPWDDVNNESLVPKLLDTTRYGPTAYGAAPANQMPTASFTLTPTSGTAPLAVSVNGTASSDPDGTISTYAWNWGDGTANGSGSTANHTYTAAGTYTLRLTVTDNDGATGTTTKTVSVAAAPPANEPPSASFTADVVSGNPPLTVSVDATGSTDSDGTIASYAWDWGDGSADGSGVTDSHEYTVVGDYTITLTVTDDDGATDDATILINVRNVPPVASFSFSTSTLNVHVDASASTDSDGTIVDYDWSWGDGTMSSGVMADHTYATHGTYNVRLTVTDDDGSSHSQTQEVTVTQPPNIPTKSRIVPVRRVVLWR